MLKIKDNVDLKELEKFGFKRSKTWWLPRYSRNYVDIFCDLPEKWLRLNEKQLQEKKVNERDIIFHDEVPEIYKESLIHDLIQAGLVEVAE